MAHPAHPDFFQRNALGKIRMLRVRNFKFRITRQQFFRDCKSLPLTSRLQIWQSGEVGNTHNLVPLPGLDLPLLARRGVWILVPNKDYA